MLGSCNDPLADLPQFADWPTDNSGYQLQALTHDFYSSFASGHEVYLGGRDGHIYLADDRDASASPRDLGAPPGEHTTRFVFVSSRGTIFSSPNIRDTHRSTDGGKSWQRNQLPGWRMAEDDRGRLYFGAYKHDSDSGPAQLFASDDDGEAWTEVFRDEGVTHIHTVRWDDRTERLYISFGDTRDERGQAVSTDRGKTFEILARGEDQGHTDIAFSRDYLFWGNDDGSGRLYRYDVQHKKGRALFAGDQFVWFIVADGDQVYAGTVPPKTARTPAALLASSDQGETWQKILEVSVDDPAYLVGVRGDSRFLSSDGWLYFVAGSATYRVRRSP